MGKKKVLPTYVGKDSVAYLYGQKSVAYLCGQKSIAYLCGQFFLKK